MQRTINGRARHLFVVVAAIFGLGSGWSVGDAMAGPAVNQFEVKDLESAPGDFEFQSQNAFSTGQPRRRAVTTPDGVTIDDNTIIRQREALEIQVGITEYFRIRLGIEFEQEALDDPANFAEARTYGPLQLDELALEGVFVFVKPKPEGVGLGLLVEYGHPLSHEPGAQKEIYIGPIIEAHTGQWTLIANLAFVKFFGANAVAGSDEVPDDKWDFAYFLQGKYDFSKNWALALEAYGTFDRIGQSGTQSDEAKLFGDFDQHRAGLIGYYTFFPGSDRPLGVSGGVDLSGADGDADGDDKELAVSIGAGALFGLNPHTPDTTYKLSVEVEF